MLIPQRFLIFLSERPMPRGGWRPNSGRKKGSRNMRPHIRPPDAKGLAELAQEYTPEATMTLVDIMRNSKSEHARISAAVHLMDRGHGKVPQGSLDDPRKQADPQDYLQRRADPLGLRADGGYPTSDDIIKEMRRRGITSKEAHRTAAQLERLEREEEAAKRKKGQTPQNEYPPRGAEQQPESDSEDS
jgi:hypothetical protein